MRNDTLIVPKADCSLYTYANFLLLAIYVFRFIESGSIIIGAYTNSGIYIADLSDGPNWQWLVASETPRTVYISMFL